MLGECHRPVQTSRRTNETNCHVAKSSPNNVNVDRQRPCLWREKWTTEVCKWLTCPGYEICFWPIRVRFAVPCLFGFYAFRFLSVAARML
ncbi:hypothetical protein AVEN_4546-1 [Araneus ventricosus]|uniref:Uncharacterized protein n=1 Tax=Araneus ventricosus TaxID=182803 RepID=A0A4Y2BLL2_ARAVE|nr:hypothetical protein AVEN_4546-1 [Araneus ventricosus]